MVPGLVARTQHRFGRKISFQLGLLVALFSAGLGAWAVSHHQFWWLVCATVVAGYYSANAQLYRFAAAELCAPAFREKAVSLVMAGGLIGAVIGPNLATRSRNMLDVPFAGAYAALAVVAPEVKAKRSKQSQKEQGMGEYPAITERLAEKVLSL